MLEILGYREDRILESCHFLAFCGFKGTEMIMNI